MSAEVVTIRTVRKRPLPIRAFNAVGGKASLDPGSLIDAARKSAKLRELGDESFVPALARLCEALDGEARLHRFGRWVTRKRLVGLLVNRLRAEHHFRAHPEILERPLYPPLVVTGLQRSGTTMLQRLIAADPRVASVGSHEAVNPAPPLHWPRGRDPRPGVAKLSERVLRYMSPEFFAIHPVEWNAPEEEVLLLDMSFLSQVPEALALVPEYSLWLESQDPTPAYAYLRKLLLLLQWQKPEGRAWVLKTPNHLEWLDTLFAVFPEATLVHAHRDPLVTLPSLLSMLFHGMRIFSDEVTPEAVGAMWSRKTARLVERALDFRARCGEAPCVDVSYYDLLKEPVARVEEIYRRAGLKLSPEARTAMEASRRENRQHKYGVHKYDLGDFGLSEAQVEPSFARYRAAYDIPFERELLAKEKRA